PTSTVLEPSAWLMFGAGRLGSCVKPTGPRSAGAGGLGTTVALNCNVATSVPVWSVKSTSHRAIPPGAALQSFTRRFEEGGVVELVDVVVDVVLVVVVEG